ncbi:glycine zipper 2TM domain-containing protein [Halapricum hydrolyticum]|uniref:YMGG-like glycine zipper-containing protein n=1 Tax=Halapricum hydrolyticum TaxID=2979991 RepID=A0AAE3IAP8_9EURY|nr:glycine zipper 2TM domain-containing protein [Halapricum hydrolyticum]MCU4717307.1 YMGG-like glycine zipper-containing protein [Halapricum hydrolyticum]MCU4726234.1 YMGG-like glycine zipper-containing protein [Halapricum hydrolyticum]
MGKRIKQTISRAKYAAIGASVGAFVGGLISRNAASTGAGLGALVGATVGEKRVSVDEFVGQVKDRTGEKAAEE